MRTTNYIWSEIIAFISTIECLTVGEEFVFKRDKNSLRT